MIFRCSVLGLALVFASTFAASAADMTGHWEGQAINGSAVTPIAFDFATRDGELTGGVSFSRSGILESPMTTVTLKRNRLRVVFMSRNVARSFDGKVRGDEINGAFTMGGEKYEASLTRVPQEKPYSEEDVVYHNGDVSIAATLFMPTSEGRHPALVMMHGSGENERYRYRFLADFYARLGIACLFADKRGCGESGGDWRKVGFEPLAWDGIRGVEWLKQREDIDPDRIGMTGISQAGWIMSLAAALSDDVNFLVVNSGANVTVEEEGYFDYIVALKDKGYGEDVLAKAHAILVQDNVVTRTSEGYEKLSEMLAEVKEEPWRKDFRFFATPAKMRANSFYKKIVDFDPVPYMEQNDIPVLWNYGADDKSVKPEDSIAILNRIDEELDKDYTTNVYPHADHGIYVAPDPEKDALPLRVYAPDYIDDVSSWLRKQVLN